MLSDVLIEDIFEVKMSTKSMLVKSILIALWPTSVLLTVLVPIAIVMFLVAALLWFFITPLLNVEYEYSYLNGELSIDKIFNKSRRKKWVVYDLKSAELVAPADSDSIKRHLHGKKVTDYSTGYEPDSEKVGIVLKGHMGAEIILLKKNYRLINAIRDMKPMIVEYSQEVTQE